MRGNCRARNYMESVNSGLRGAIAEVALASVRLQKARADLQCRGWRFSGRQPALFQIGHDFSEAKKAIRKVRASILGFVETNSARVAKLVDAADLKSADCESGRVGSTPTPGTRTHPRPRSIPA